MFESLLTILITGSSVLLFGYWFRYTCMLILSAKTTRDYAGEFATANQLNFRTVQSQLREGGDLNQLHSSLDKDYERIMSLLQNASSASMESRMLQINYKMMGMWSKVSRRFSAEMGRQALEEMSSVIAHFANSMGEQAACGAAA